jgi:hypothetical protein
LNQETRNPGNGVADIEGKVATVTATELGSDRVSKQEKDQEFLEFQGFWLQNLSLIPKLEVGNPFPGFLIKNLKRPRS